MRTLYTFFIHGYGLLIKMASVFNSKAGKWVDGRRDWLSKLDTVKGKTKVYWFHFASLGEFEQGRPIMEQLKTNDPDIFLLVTFFSPSGYEVRKDYPLADLISYLPIDTPSNSRIFLDRIKPEKVFFIKYEFWFNYLNELQIRNIDTFLISGIFRPNQHFFKWYGSWFKNNLNVFNHFFLQNSESVSLLNKAGFKNTTYCGDTRFDRVIDVAEAPKKIAEIEQLISDQKVFIIGSNWPEDDQILFPFMNEGISKFCFVMAPHNMSEKQFQSIENSIDGKVVRLSKVKPTDKAADVIIIDSIGHLSSIYQYGDFAYIGGGFGKNVHNVLEAAVYSIPCLFGPNFRKFQECKDLLALKGAFSLNSTDELRKIMKALQKEGAADIAGQIAGDYVKKNSGATEKIMAYLLTKN